MTSDIANTILKRILCMTIPLSLVWIPDCLLRSDKKNSLFVFMSVNFDNKMDNPAIFGIIAEKTSRPARNTRLEAGVGNPYNETSRKGQWMLDCLHFTAIDFETANTNPDSACALGIAVVEDGRIVERKSWLIRPPTDEFSFTYIHGLTWQQVAGAPDFGELWPQIGPYLTGRKLAAHNARFDLGVFFALIRQYHIGFWRGQAIDSVAVARRIWPELPNHQLHTVAAHLNIPLRHQDACSDAHACAEILCRAERLQGGVLDKAARWYGR